MDPCDLRSFYGSESAQNVRSGYPTGSQTADGFTGLRSSTPGTPTPAPHFRPADLPIIEQQHHFRPAGAPNIGQQHHFRPAASYNIGPRQMQVAGPAVNPYAADYETIRPASRPGGHLEHILHDFERPDSARWDPRRGQISAPAVNPSPFAWPRRSAGENQAGAGGGGFAAWIERRVAMVPPALMAAWRQAPGFNPAPPGGWPPLYGPPRLGSVASAASVAFHSQQASHNLGAQSNNGQWTGQGHPHAHPAPASTTVRSGYPLGPGNAAAAMYGMGSSNEEPFVGQPYSTANQLPDSIDPALIDPNMSFRRVAPAPGPNNTMAAASNNPNADSLEYELLQRKVRNSAHDAGNSPVAHNIQSLTENSQIAMNAHGETQNEVDQLSTVAHMDVDSDTTEIADPAEYYEFESSAESNSGESGKENDVNMSDNNSDDDDGAPTPHIPSISPVDALSANNNNDLNAAYMAQLPSPPPLDEQALMNMDAFAAMVDPALMNMDNNDSKANGKVFAMDNLVKLNNNAFSDINVANSMANKNMAGDPTKANGAALTMENLNKLNNTTFSNMGAFTLMPNTVLADNLAHMGMADADQPRPARPARYLAAVGQLYPDALFAVSRCPPSAHRTVQMKGVALVKSCVLQLGRWVNEGVLFNGGGEGDGDDGGEDGDEGEGEGEGGFKAAASGCKVWKDDGVKREWERVVGGDESGEDGDGEGDDYDEVRRAGAGDEDNDDGHDDEMYALLLLRRDWPIGGVALLPNTDHAHEFIEAVKGTFDVLPGGHEVFYHLPCDIAIEPRNDGSAHHHGDEDVNGRSSGTQARGRKTRRKDKGKGKAVEEKGYKTKGKKGMLVCRAYEGRKGPQHERIVLDWMMENGGRVDEDELGRDVLIRMAEAFVEMDKWSNFKRAPKRKRADEDEDDDESE
ncbi:hypothetical protein NEMBOFW57_010810 [Staphylotrichum longicolle]|uniref:Uncharacterized protein n=1 Tax=Staphylotrichum longicolle TaxID=669026 RepID=A0AAD4ES57_9PEZI|nr:hypothetical protein NEMBOFW57_010810 [Staphylotrichum longicolle]